MLLAALLCLAPLQDPPPAPPPPNVVLILADDLGIGDLGCYNPDSKIPTPSLDRLAAQGTRFHDAHSPSAVCTPTRYGILTGRYAWRTPLRRGVLFGNSPCLVEPGRDTIALLLRRHGYVTACIGKWHLGLGEPPHTQYNKPLHPGPLDCGFDEFFGIPASLNQPPYLYLRNDGVVQAASGWSEGPASPGQDDPTSWPSGRAAPDFRHAETLPRLSEEALQFLRAQAADPAPKPFFLYYALTAPHTPWLPGAEYRGRSKAGSYGDLVAEVDGVVGRVLDALEELKLDADTLVLVSSDNGSHWPEEYASAFAHRANLHYRGQKGDIWEGGHRVPLLIRWPGQVAAAGENRDLVCLTDIYATLAELLGEPLADGVAPDSFSFLPALRGTPAGGPHRDSVVLHSFHGMYALRRGPWKLVFGRGSGGFTEYLPGADEPKGQLYQLEEDPGEKNNLFEKHPELVKELEELMAKLRRDGRSRPFQSP